MFRLNIHYYTLRRNRAPGKAAGKRAQLMCEMFLGMTSKQGKQRTLSDPDSDIEEIGHFEEKKLNN